MFTVTIKAILSLFPFVREIVENLQKGPRDRRAKNPLTPWFVICLVFMIATAAIGGRYMFDLMDQVHDLTLKRADLEHQLSLKAQVVEENLDLRKRLGRMASRADDADERHRKSQEELSRSLAETKRVTEVTQRLVVKLDETTRKVGDLELANQQLTTQLNEALRRQPATVVVRPNTQTNLLSDRLRELAEDLATN